MGVLLQKHPNWTMIAFGFQEKVGGQLQKMGL